MNNNVCVFLVTNNEGENEKKKKTVTLMLLWEITKTFTGKQAQSGNFEQKHHGEK